MSNREQEGKGIEDREFYELMQAYRHSPITDQPGTVRAFEAVKDFVRRLTQATSPEPPCAFPECKQTKGEHTYLTSTHKYQPVAPQETAKDRICAEIQRIMWVYREQEKSDYGVDTPGGLEHMGDVWKLFSNWDKVLEEQVSCGGEVGRVASDCPGERIPTAELAPLPAGIETAEVEPEGAEPSESEGK